MKKKDIVNFLNFLQDVIKHEQVFQKKSKYEAHDLYVSRLIVASSEGNLLALGNRFSELLNSPHTKAEALIKASASGSANELKVWCNEQPKIIIALALSTEDRDSLIDSVLDAYVSPQLKFKPIHRRPPFDVNIRAYVSQALSHGDDVKAGNSILFRRGSVGGGVRLPYYSANAVGHGLRNALAEHFLNFLGFRLDMSKPQYAIWFHHFLFSGGIMADGAIPKRFVQKLQGAAAGAVRSDGVRELRDMFPFFSLLGGVAKAPLEGRLYIYDLRPECVEWGNGSIPVQELFDWRFSTRHDTYEGRINKSTAKEQSSDDGNTSMLVNTEVLKEGSILEGGINVSPHITEVEKGALDLALQIMKAKGRFGGKKHRGHGLLEIQYSDITKRALVLYPEPYLTYLSSNKKTILAYINKIGAEPCI